MNIFDDFIQGLMLTTIETIETRDVPSMSPNAFWAPSGEAWLRIEVDEFDEFGTLSIEPVVELDDDGPPTSHPFYHESQCTPLGEMLAGCDDVFEWCLRNGLAPGQRAWIWLSIGYTGGYGEHPEDVDVYFDWAIRDRDPMSAEESATRWQSFMSRRARMMEADEIYPVESQDGLRRYIVTKRKEPARESFWRVERFEAEDPAANKLIAFADPIAAWIVTRELDGTPPHPNGTPPLTGIGLDSFFEALNEAHGIIVERDAP